MTDGPTGRRVLVFRIGALGDTLIALPALWRVRRHFHDARITLLCERQVGKSYVLASDLLADSGLIDDFLHYPTGGGRVARAYHLARLLWTLRWRRYDTLVYLMPSVRTDAQVLRDKRFFDLAGVGRRIGLRTLAVPANSAEWPREADLVEQRLDDDISPGDGRFDLDLRAADHAAVDSWLAGQPADGGRPWVGVGPGSKMPVKVWPPERYAEVVDRLIGLHDVWPVVFGDAGDRAVGERLVAGWGRGVVAAGALGLRASAAALARCRLYLGNDTGTMHLAASTGTRCVGVFASIAPLGKWWPLGGGHRVFRTEIDCAGCALVRCVERKMACILRVTPAEVAAACDEVLADQVDRPTDPSRPAYAAGCEVRATPQPAIRTTSR